MKWKSQEMDNSFVPMNTAIVREVICVLAFRLYLTSAMDEIDPKKQSETGASCAFVFPIG